MYQFIRVTDIGLAGLISRGLKQYNHVFCSPQTVLSTPHYAIMDQGKLMGWIGYWRRKNQVCEIRHLTVLPQYQRHGVGRAGVLFLINMFETEGEGFCCAVIREGNLPSQQLFRSLSFSTWRRYTNVRIYVKQLSKVHCTR